MGYLLWFLTVGIMLGILQASYGDIIYEFHPDPGKEKREQLKEKMEIIKNAPCLWKTERWLHRFSGVVVGWIMFWILLDQRMKLFSGVPDLSSLGIVDLVLFLLGWIGINGRLPTIAHDVQNWFRR